MYFLVNAIRGSKVSIVPPEGPGVTLLLLGALLDPESW
jgi:hypothetical protein